MATLDTDAMLARFRERAQAVKKRPLPPVAGEERQQFIEQAKREGRLVVAVGTTVVRTLEASAASHGSPRAGPGRTRMCIYPPYAFRVVDALVTNFHLPRSTLLALVMAFASPPPAATVRSPPAMAAVEALAAAGSAVSPSATSMARRVVRRGMW